MKCTFDELRQAVGTSVLLVAIGNPQRRDDAAGLHLAKNIAAATDWDCIECEDVPENYTYDMRTHEARIILFVDAIDMRAEPGTISIIEPDELAGESISTHKPSLKLLAMVLQGKNTITLREQPEKCVLLLGIQPACIEFGTGLSEPVADAVNSFTTT